MAIKMRYSKSGTKCSSCGVDQYDCLAMVDVMIGSARFSLCDECNEELLNKTLKVEVAKNAKVKDRHDREIIRKRNEARRNTSYFSVNSGMTKEDFDELKRVEKDGN